MLLSEPTILEASCFETKRSRFARCMGLCLSLVLRVTQLNTAKVTKWRVIAVIYRKTVEDFLVATALSSQYSARDTLLGNTDDSYTSLLVNEDALSCKLHGTCHWLESDRNSVDRKVRCYVNPNFKDRIHKSQSKMNLHPQTFLILS